MLRNAREGGGVYDPALHSVTGGCMAHCYITPAFILPDNFILPCRFALIPNGVPASQKRCYSSYLQFENVDILSAFR